MNGVNNGPAAPNVRGTATNFDLYKAAEFFGYSDPSYVSRLYKKLFGSNITDGLLKNETTDRKE